MMALLLYVTEGTNPPTLAALNNCIGACSQCTTCTVRVLTDTAEEVQVCYTSIG